MSHPGQETELRQLRDRLEQEANRIRIQGRALTEAEHARVDAIESALPLVEEALEILEASGRWEVVAVDLPGAETTGDYTAEAVPYPGDEAATGLPGDEPTPDYTEERGAQA